MSFSPRSITPSKLVQGSQTVGLDHIPMKGVTPEAVIVPDGVMVVDYDRCEIVYWPSWSGWRESKRLSYLFGIDDRWGFRTIEKGARDAFFKFSTDNDYRQVRGLMRDAGMAVNPYDTITPERIIENG